MTCLSLETKLCHIYKKKQKKIMSSKIDMHTKFFITFFSLPFLEQTNKLLAAPMQLCLAPALLI